MFHFRLREVAQLMIKSSFNNIEGSEPECFPDEGVHLVIQSLDFIVFSYVILS